MSVHRAVRVVFCDLDGTFFPGAFEDPPQHERQGFLRNLARARILEDELNIPVIYATGNNLAIAQSKFFHPQTGEALRDLRQQPGIYCNGALVKGASGKELFSKSLGQCMSPTGSNFIETFVDTWAESLRMVAAQASSGDDAGHRLFADCCLIGLGKEKVVLLDHDAYSHIPGSLARSAGTAFLSRMDLASEYFDWVPAATLREMGDDILSFLMMFPRVDSVDPGPEPRLLDAQAWLDRNGLLTFADAERALTNGGPSAAFAVVCKHVHVPGIGPEIDISPVGVNKGSAIVTYLQAQFASAVPNEHIAVFGDAGNDIELFGMKRTKSGADLEPLFEQLQYRPVVRVAMPWANDELLVRDSTEQASCSEIFDKIIREQQRLDSRPEPRPRRRSLPKRIIVIRHGHRFNDSPDPDLTPLGFKQAAELPSRLAELGLDDVDFIFSSPMGRALQTAAPVAKSLELPIHVEHGFCELLAHNWLFSENPHPAVRSIRWATDSTF
jgi:hydroxymethylpyrimidine pyrophosphatase-like HAD family hydrolase